MNNISTQNIQDGLKCEDVDCGEKLGYFDIKNRSRFCFRCRNKQTKVMRWKCKGCENILSGSQYRETKRYCDICKGLRMLDF